MCYIYHSLNCVTATNYVYGEPALTCPIFHLCVLTALSICLQSKLSLIPHGGAAEISQDTVGYAYDVINVHQTAKLQQLIRIYTTIKKTKNKITKAEKKTEQEDSVT